jgi:four helix bundle protein
MGKGKDKGEMEKERRPHKNLEVWKNSIEVAKKIYQITSSYPPTETYGLISQMRRSSVSIPSNISEGAARTGRKEFLQFINIAQGSISELDTQIELSKELGFIKQDDYETLLCKLTVISKQLYGLARRVKQVKCEM